MYRPKVELDRMLACIDVVARRQSSDSGRGATLCSALVWEFGYSELGSGFFSAVFEHPTEPDKVIKVGGDLKDSWLGFAMYVRENPADCFPVIDSLILHETYYVAVMERLCKFNVCDKERLGWIKSTEHRGDSVARNKARMHWLEKVCGSPAVRMFSRFGERGVDPHSGNLMMRGGTLVITDPYAQRTLDGYDPSKYCHKGYKIDLFKEIEREKAREERLAVLGQGPETRRAQEDQALRLHPVDVNKFDPARMAGILPQMQRKVLGSKTVADIARRAGRVPQFVFRNEAPAPSIRHVDGVRGKRADVCIVDELAPQRWGRGFVENTVRSRVEQKVREGRAAAVHADFAAIERRFIAQHAALLGPNLVHALDAKFLEAAGIGRAVVAPAWDDRPQVPVRPHKPGNGGLPEFRRKHWERGNKLPRGLRYNRGCAKRDQSGAVRAVGSVVGDEPWAGEAGPCNLGITEVRTCYRLMGRPGQGGAGTQQEAGKIAEAARSEYDMVGFT